MICNFSDGQYKKITKKNTVYTKHFVCNRIKRKSVPGFGGMWS